jgi:hypothetical protein
MWHQNVNQELGEMGIEKQSRQQREMGVEKRGKHIFNT